MDDCLGLSVAAAEPPRMGKGSNFHRLKGSLFAGTNLAYAVLLDAGGDERV